VADLEQCLSGRARFQENEALKKRVAELEKERNNAQQNWYCSECKKFHKHDIDRLCGKELRTRVAEQAEELKEWKDDQASCMAERCGDEVHCTCVPSLRRAVKELQTRLSTILKASEGMEKALEGINCEAGRIFPKIRESDKDSKAFLWIAEESGKALADFRAVKETMEKGAGK